MQNSCTAGLRRMLLGLGLVLLGLVSFVPAALASSAGPSLSFNPSSWTASPIGSGTTTSQTFTLMNTGGRSAGTVDLSLSGSAAFSIKAGSDSCTGNGLGPGRPCSVTIVYAPTSNGESDTATLHANGEHASTSASLSGSSTNPFAKAQSDCEALGGTFSTDPSTDRFGVGAGFVWSCNNGPSQAFDTSLLFPDCVPNGGNTMEFSGSPPFDSTCFKI